jgi:hypothetical protein
VFNQEINLSSLAWGSPAVLAKVREKMLAEFVAGAFSTVRSFTGRVPAILIFTGRFGKGVSEHAVTIRIAGEAVVSELGAARDSSPLSLDAATPVVFDVGELGTTRNSSPLCFDTTTPVILGGSKLVGEHPVGQFKRSSGSAVNFVAGTARPNIASLAIRTGAFPCLTSGTLLPLACKVVGENGSRSGKVTEHAVTLSITGEAVVVSQFVQVFATRTHI